MACQIAAVHRRDIDRLERPEVRGAVPVEEMAFEPLQLAQCRQRRLEPLDDLGRPGPAEVAGSHTGHEIEPNIGRRGPPRHNRSRLLLEVVRRQHVVGRGDEGLEIAPGPPGDQAKLCRILTRQGEPCRRARRPAGPKGDCGCGEPKQGHGHDGGPGGRVHCQGTSGHGEPENGTTRHASVEAPQLQPWRCR